MSSRFTKPFNPLPWHSAPHDFTGDFQLGPHTVETIQRYIYGTRYLTWDGRVFKYGKAGATCYSYFAVARKEGSSADSVYATNPVDGGQIGDRHVSVTLGSSTLTGDELAGGYIFIYDKSSTKGNIQRGIVGNEATANAITKIYLDYPLQIAVIGPAGTDDAFEVFHNPYRSLQNIVDNYEYAPWMGVPCRNATVDQMFWLQTWGPCTISPGEAAVYAPDTNSRDLVFFGNGALGAMKGVSTTGYQKAGYHLTCGTAAYGPLFMLMCST